MMKRAAVTNLAITPTPRFRFPIPSLTLPQNRPPVRKPPRDGDDGRDGLLGKRRPPPKVELPRPEPDQPLPNASFRFRDVSMPPIMPPMMSPMSGPLLNRPRGTS